jgi:hypothetical protein
MRTSPTKPSLTAPTEDDAARNGETGTCALEHSLAEQQPQLTTLLLEESPDVLEKGVENGLILLDQVAAALDVLSSRERKPWQQKIDELKARARPKPAVVSVVGNTGAGKSSVINALLNEERLLPTNCLRACTAAPVEISYNHSDDPKQLYRSEVEFITKEEWKSELSVLFSELVDGNGSISREISLP